jgi:Fe-S-cluster containining protein
MAVLFCKRPSRQNDPQIKMQNDERRMQNEELKNAVVAAATQSDAAGQLRLIYTELQQEIERRKPICVASGKCCNFESYGHRLYVTTLELAVFTTDLELVRSLTPSPGTPGEGGGEGDFERRTTRPIPNRPHPNPLPEYRERGPEARSGTALPVVSGGCPLQTGRLCGVHSIRPFGCRIFFCDPTATQWQQDQYEAFHARIKSLHERFSIPYFYVEWRAALAAMGITADGR